MHIICYVGKVISPLSSSTKATIILGPHGPLTMSLLGYGPGFRLRLRLSDSNFNFRLRLLIKLSAFANFRLRLF